MGATRCEKMRDVVHVDVGRVPLREDSERVGEVAFGLVDVVECLSDPCHELGSSLRRGRKHGF